MKPGSDVLLMGAGPMGHVVAQLLKLNGAARVTVAAPAGSKLDLIARLAADDVVAVDRKDLEVHRRRLREVSPSGFYIVEATGSTTLLEDALSFVRRRSTVLVYAVYPGDAIARFKPADIMRRELTIRRFGNSNPTDTLLICHYLCGLSQVTANRGLPLSCRFFG